MTRYSMIAGRTDDGEDAIHLRDTVPPPETGDAYSAATQVRELPPELLAILKKMESGEADGDVAGPVTVPSECRAGAVAPRADSHPPAVVVASEYVHWDALEIPAPPRMPSEMAPAKPSPRETSRPRLAYGILMVATAALSAGAGALLAILC